MVADNSGSSEYRSAFYTRIYRQSFSSDGQWLIASDSRSQLCLFSMQESVRATGDIRRPLQSARIKCPSSVFALQSIGELVVCGDADGALLGYRLGELIAQIEQRPSGLLTYPSTVFNVNPAIRSTLPSVEINSITALDKQSQLLYAGAGDCDVRLVDLERPESVIMTFNGHTDYVTEIVQRSENDFASASMDGTVRIWDRRDSKSGIVINAAQEASLKRNGCGRGVCALDVHDDFMVCGGGMDLGLWHIGSRSLITVMKCNRPATMHHNVAKMNQQRILTAGCSPNLYEFDFSGAHFTTLKTSASSIYSIESTNTLTVVAGDSYLIDVLLNLGYVAFSLNCSALDANISNHI